MRLNGRYRISSNGIVLSEQSNLITTVGKDFFLRFVAGINQDFGRAIAVGASSAAAAIENTELGFEFGRCPIALRSVDFSTREVIFKGTLASGIPGSIYEIGLYPEMINSGAGAYQSRLICQFNSQFEAWTNASASNTDTAQSRISNNGIMDTISSNNGTVTHVLTGLSVNLSGYSPLDSFVLAIYNGSATLANITVAFTNSAGQTMTGTFTPTGTGWQTIAVAKGSFANYAAYDMTYVTTITVVVTATGTAGSTPCVVTLDGLSVRDNDTVNPDYALLSRAVLGSPIVKSSVIPLDIEYALGLGI